MLLKFCGMTRQADLDQALKLDADMCGFIFHRASPRYIEPEKAADLNSGNMLRVGVFVDASLEEIERASRAAWLDLLQLHGSQSREFARHLGKRRIIKVFWPQASSIALLQNELDAWENDCAMILLDAGSKGGGSGKTLPWTELGKLHFPVPWLLAGGLSPENLKLALETCQPDGVDLNSGVETAHGIKNHALMQKARQIIT